MFGQTTQMRKLTLAWCAALGAASLLAGCGTSASHSTVTTVVIKEASPTSTATSTPPATVTVTAAATSTANPVQTTPNVPDQPLYDFPSNARATCMTADYATRIPITDPGLRTQAGHRTTCGFAQRIASLVRASMHTDPSQSTLNLSVYSSTFNRNKPISCTVTGQIADCYVADTEENIWVSVRGSQG